MRPGGDLKYVLWERGDDFNGQPVTEIKRIIRSITNWKWWKRLLERKVSWSAVSGMDYTWQTKDITWHSNVMQALGFEYKVYIPCRTWLLSHLWTCPECCYDNAYYSLWTWHPSLKTLLLTTSDHYQLGLYILRHTVVCFCYMTPPPPPFFQTLVVVPVLRQFSHCI